MSSDGSEFRVGVFIGGLIAAFIWWFAIFVVIERGCEAEHNIYDCEMLFVPAKPPNSETKEGE